MSALAWGILIPSLVWVYVFIAALYSRAMGWAWQDKNGYDSAAPFLSFLWPLSIPWSLANWASTYLSKKSPLAKAEVYRKKR